MLYFQDTIDDEPDKNTIVFIDEIEQFLSPAIQLKLWEFLKKNFPDFSFVITSHSNSFVRGVNDANIIILDTDDYEFLDANDYKSEAQVQLVFDRIFGNNVRADDTISVQLRKLYNNSIAGVWSKVDEKRFLKLKEQRLSKSQQLILRQVEDFLQRNT